MHTFSSAKRTCRASASAVEWTATDRSPMSTRREFAQGFPRLAISTFLNTVMVLSDSTTEDSEADPNRCLPRGKIVLAFSMRNKGCPYSTCSAFFTRNLEYLAVEIRFDLVMSASWLDDQGPGLCARFGRRPTKGGASGAGHGRKCHERRGRSTPTRTGLFHLGAVATGGGGARAGLPMLRLFPAGPPLAGRCVFRRRVLLQLSQSNSVAISAISRTVASSSARGRIAAPHNNKTRTSSRLFEPGLGFAHRGRAPFLARGPTRQGVALRKTVLHQGKAPALPNGRECEKLRERLQRQPVSPQVPARRSGQAKTEPAGKVAEFLGA